MSSLIFLLVATALISHVSAHAGFEQPPPRGPACLLEGEFDDCGLIVPPCGAVAPGNATVLPAGIEYEIRLFQKIPHGNPENTYTINWVPEVGEPIEVVSRTQTTEEQEEDIFIVFNVTLPETGGAGFMQMVFNTTAAGGDVYYSCADVVVEAAAITSSSIEMTTTEEMTSSSEEESSTTESSSQSSSNQQLAPASSVSVSFVSLMAALAAVMKFCA